MATAIGAVLVAGAFVIGLRPIVDNSFLTHLATGRVILESGVPTTDPFGSPSSSLGSPWVVQSWLPATTYALLERLGGGPGADGGLQLVRLLTGVLSGLLAALVFRLTRPARTLVARLGITTTVVLIGAGFWVARPLLVGLVLLAVALVVVTERRSPWWLVPVFWLWVNSHGSFPLGLVAIAAVVVGRFLDGDRRADGIGALGGAVGGVLVGAALSPVGFDLLTFPFHLLERSSVLADHVQEWKRFSFPGLSSKLVLVELLVAVAASVRARRWEAAVPTLVFGMAALLAVRNIPVAAVAVVPALALGLAGIGGRSGEERIPASSALLGVAALLAVGFGARELARPPLDRSELPVGALAALEAATGSDGGTAGRVVAPDVVGNYLAYRDGPAAGIFVDDRYDMVPRPVLDDYVALAEGRAGLEVLDEYRADWLVWPAGTTLIADAEASPAWRVPYDDGTWALACRAAAPDCPTAGGGPGGGPGG